MKLHQRLSIKGIVHPKIKIHVAANTWDYCHFYKLFGFQQAHFSGNKQIIYIYLQKKYNGHYCLCQNIIVTYYSYYATTVKLW